MRWVGWLAGFALDVFFINPYLIHHTSVGDLGTFSQIGTLYGVDLMVILLGMAMASVLE